MYLLGLFPLCAGAADVPGESPGQRIIVKWKANTGRSQIQSLSSTTQNIRDAKGLDLQAYRSIDNRRDVLRSARKLSDAELQSALSSLRTQTDVEYAVLDQRRRLHAAVAPNDTFFTATSNRSGQWYLQATEAAALNAINAWGVTQGSSNVVVAVLDTGVRFDHPDLTGKLLSGYDFVSAESSTSFLTANDGNGWDADASDPGDWINASDQQNSEFEDCDISGSSWHGTRVSGIIGASTNNNLGIAGAGWNTMILPVRVMGKCGGYDSDILAGMRWAAGLNVSGVPTNTHAAKVINVSLGSAGACTQAYQDVINEIRAVGAIVVASAGNESGPTDTPANCSGVIGVAGLRNEGDKVGFSSLGTGVAISAPAGNCVNASGACLYSIDTTYNLGATTPGTNSYTDQTDYNLGTSFSAPMVSGVVALMYAVNPSLRPDLVTSRLQASATAFPTVSATTCHVPTSSSDTSQTSACNCTTATCGAGMLNAYNAALASQKPVINISGPTTAIVGQSVALDGSTSSAADGNALSYAWTVVSGTPSVSNSDQSIANVTMPASTGAITVRLTATDDLGASSSQDWTISVSSTAAAVYTVGGTVSGLSGTGLVLQNNAGNTLTIAANGAFSFSTSLASGKPYAVTVKTQPTNPPQTCAIVNSSGTIANANVTNIAVVCTVNTYSIGGSVSGLTGSGLVLQNNDGDALAIAANGSFSFSAPLASGSAYSVSVKTQPTNPTQSCVAANATGIVSNAAVSDITVSCTTVTAAVSSTGSGGGGGGILGIGELLALSGLTAVLRGLRGLRARSRGAQQFS